jgi:two-component system cell cycle sensor histidine kinase/response regulator CckA
MSKHDLTTPFRVLHLEDSPRDAEVVRHKLAADGLSCDILVVQDQASFEAALIAHPFALILLDYNLRGYDGISALKHAQLTRPDVPVILISGTVGDEDAVKCLHFGATDYLLKDRLDRLVPAVRRAVVEAETRRARRRVGASLAESEARKAAVLDSVLDCIVTMDAGGLVLEFNAAAARTFGYTKADAIGRPLADLIIPPRFREMHRTGLAHYLATGDGRVIGKLIEIVAMRSDGSELPVELAITAIHSEKAPIFTGVLRDISARQQAEATLRVERDRAERYLDAPEVILLALDTNGAITLANRYACSILGWTAEELIGRDWIETCVPARLREARRQTFNDLVAGDISMKEQPVLTRSGEERLIEWRNTLQRDDLGRVIGTFSSGTDITERSRAVEALRAGDERTRFALESANVGIWDMDYTTGVLRWSETLEAQYGLAPGTFNGTFDEFIERVHPDDRQSLLDTVGAAMRSGSDFSTQNRSLWPDGTVRWLSGAGRIHLGEHGTPLRGVGISLDVTEARSLEAQYQQAQKMEAIGQLAAGVAHDFNNLLTVILGFCELLLEDLDPAEPRHADIVEIQRAGERAAGLTRQLLTFSRKEIVEPTLLDVNAIVANMRVLLGRLIGEDVAIVLKPGSAVATVKADRGQLEQIVLNLAVNARDAMPKGGTLTIETCNVARGHCPPAVCVAVTADQCVALKVTDTGTGMPPEVLARLFEPFFTTKAVGKGTGLGLASVHGIATRSGGAITVDSKIGRGTSFTVYFPAASGVEPALAPAPAAPAPAVARTILVVEDAEGLRGLTKRLLERQGYTVLVAANADEARVLFERHRSIDLLLTDVVMPGASGPELVRQLVAQRPALKVLYMSGYTDEAIVHHGVLDPGIDFVAKPFTAATLGQKIRDVLNRDVVRVR